jgi:hypothetical protein
MVVCWFNTAKKSVVDYSIKTKRILVGVGIVDKESKENK